MLSVHFSSCDTKFHIDDVEGSSNLRPYQTDLFLFSTSDVVEANLRGLVGW